MGVWGRVARSKRFLAGVGVGVVCLAGLGDRHDVTGRLRLGGLDWLSLGGLGHGRDVEGHRLCPAPAVPVCPWRLGHLRGMCEDGPCSLGGPCPPLGGLGVPVSSSLAEAVEASDDVVLGLCDGEGVGPGVCQW